MDTLPKENSVKIIIWLSTVNSVFSERNEKKKKKKKKKKGHL